MRALSLAMTLTGIGVVSIGLVLWEPAFMVAGALGIIIAQTVREASRA
jgi:hypothetical protein